MTSSGYKVNIYHVNLGVCKQPNTVLKLHTWSTSCSKYTKSAPFLLVICNIINSHHLICILTITDNFRQLIYEYGERSAEIEIRKTKRRFFNIRRETVLHRILSIHNSYTEEKTLQHKYNETKRLNK